MGFTALSLGGGIGLIILVTFNLLVEAKKYKRFSTNWWLSLFSVIPIEV